MKKNNLKNLLNMPEKSIKVFRTISKVNEILIQKYGIPYRPQNPPNPVDMLIATILSQNTNDKNSYKAFLHLKNNYHDWYEVATLSISRIVREIKIAGLAEQKSKAIKNLLTSLIEKNGSISLEYLLKFSNEEILKELTNYKGIGIKTASCVLLFSFKKNICPVDTHVHRTTNRIGIVCTKAPDKTFLILNKNLPQEIAHSFHTNLIRLGREICKPTNQNCFICPLKNICRYPEKNFKIRTASKENKFLLLDNI